MALNRKKTLRGAGYAAFALLSLVFCLYLTFPGDAVAQRIRYEIQRRSNGAVTASVGSASLSFPLGVSAHDVELRVKRENDDDVRVPLESLGASLDLLSLVTLTLKPRVSADIGDGSVSAAFIQGDQDLYIEAEIDELNLIKPPVLPSFLGIPMTGTLSTDGDYTLAKKPTESSGAMQIRFNGVSLGPGPVAGFTIPEAIGLGDVSLTLAAKEGKLVIEDYRQEGGQVDLQLSGDMALNPRFSSSNLNACVKFKFTDEAFLKQYPKLETAVQLAGARFKQDGDGYLNVPLRGLLSTPRGGTGIRAGRGVCGEGSRSSPGGRNRTRPPQPRTSDR